MMKPKSLLMTSLLAGAALWPALASAENAIESEVAGAPAFVIPDVENVEAEAPGAASNPMLEMIRREMAEKYSDNGPVDGARLGALLDGSYMKDYTGNEMGGPVQFSNSVFDSSARPAPPPPPETVQEPAKQDPSEAFALFLSTPEGIRALSSMNGDQIEAIAMMMEMMRNPDAAPAAPRQQQAQQALLSGIPALGTADLNRMEPEDLVRMAMESVKPKEVNLGNGKDIYLSSWKAGQDADGNFYLVNDHLPGSQISVMIGDVVGEFGPVVEAVADPARGAKVTFQSGDVIAEREPPNLENGIPAIGEPGGFPGDMLSGEIIVSTPASGDDEKIEPAPGSEADSGAESVETKSANAPETSIRPMPKPKDLGKGEEASKPKPKT